MAPFVVTTTVAVEVKSSVGPCGSIGVLAVLEVEVELKVEDEAVMYYRS